MSELDAYLGPRRQAEDDVHLTAADFQPAFYEEPQKAAVLDVAAMLLRIMGNRKEYRACGDKMREDLKNCARKLIRNSRGDVAGVLDLEAQVKREGFLAGALKMSLSPYGLVPKLVTLYERTSGDAEETAQYRKWYGGAGPLTAQEKHHLDFMKAESKWPPKE